VGRRRHWLVWAIVTYTVIIAVVGFALVNLYRASHDRLDQALGDRLLAVAVSLATITDGQMIPVTFDSKSTNASLDFLEADFQRLSQEQELAEISLTLPDGIVLFSTNPSLGPGLPNDFWELDRGAVVTALDGVAASTRLYLHRNNYQKSAHAPVHVFDAEFGEDFVAAIITVSGNSDFFDSLAQLKRGALLTGAGVLLVLVLLGVFLYRINLSFERYQESIRRQESLVAMGRMTAGIAHEIRNPLSIIRGAGQHLHRVLESAGISDPVADFIPEEVDRLDHILSGYLAFSTDREFPFEPFDLALCLRRSARLVQEEMDLAGIQVTLPEVLKPVLVLGDPLKLQQVILNLLINARHAMPEGGVIQLDLLTNPKDTAMATVTDEGSGLAGIDPHRLFEPFWTTKEKGSGLGLAMSRRIVEEMNGSLDLRERTDRTGAVAEIKLPVHEDGS
jgi:signal transduction histidine kinase